MEMVTETETNIIEGLRQRSPKVQQTALEQYGSYVWAQVVRLVPAVEDAEEVHQDVFIKVFSNINSYISISVLSPQMLRNARS